MDRATTAANAAMSRIGYLIALLLLLASASAEAQDGRQNQPGQFDFYVLSLSAWTDPLTGQRLDVARRRDKE